jgi:hypothetical protein
LSLKKDFRFTAIKKVLQLLASAEIVVAYSWRNRIIKAYWCKDKVEIIYANTDRQHSRTQTHGWLFWHILKEIHSKSSFSTQLFPCGISFPHMALNNWFKDIWYISLCVYKIYL